MTELNSARSTIYSALSRWVGENVAHGDAIPVYRDGKRIGTLPDDILYKGLEVEQILEASKQRNALEIRAEIESLKKLAEYSSKLFHGLAELDAMGRVSLDQAPKEKSNHTEIRVVQALGTTASNFAALGDLDSALQWKIKALEAELPVLKQSRGRPRTEATHRVALGLAKLYVSVCGKKPTFSENTHGLSGQYSPALRDLFDSLGWDDHIRGPAESAIKQVCTDGFDTELNASVGGFPSDPSP